MGFYRAKSTGESSILTFLVGVVMTFVWMNYGVMVDDSTIQTVNAIGLMLQVGLLIIIPMIMLMFIQRLLSVDLRVLFLLHHLPQATDREEDLPDCALSAHGRHLHHDSGGRHCSPCHETS